MMRSGPCIGGPYKGQRLDWLEPVYYVARRLEFQLVPVAPDEHVAVPIAKGSYRFHSGAWWWEGWGKDR